MGLGNRLALRYRVVRIGKMESIVLKYREQMVRLARVLLRDDEEARDVAGDVVERALKVRPTGDEPALRGWLMQCVRNACTDRIRRLRTRERFLRLYPLDDRDEGVSADDLERLWTDIRRFIDSGLTEQDRRVLLLRFDEGCTYREIGRRLGISEAAVYKHLAQALHRLRLHFRKNEQLTIG